MVKRKEVGISFSSKKKRGFHISDPKRGKKNQESSCEQGFIYTNCTNKFMTPYPCICTGKCPIMQFDTTSESSDCGNTLWPSKPDSDVRVVRKKRKKTIKEADYPEAEYETENHTKSENKSEGGIVFENEDNGRNPLISDVLEAPTSDYSFDSVEEWKTKRLLPTNYFGKLQIEKGIAYHRSNLRTATSSIHELTFSASHLKALRRIPSWYMFEAIHKHGGKRMMSRCDKSEEVIFNILLSYNQDTDHFILGGKELQLTGRDVALIFGIVCATKKIPFKKPNARNAKWVKRNFGKDTKSSLNKTLIFNRMTSILDRTDETSVEDVARLMHCYLMVLVLTPLLVRFRYTSYNGRNPLINDVLERLLLTNYFGKLQIEKGIAYHRSNLRTATSSIHELTFSASHLKALRRIPSWYMFEAIHKHGGERIMSRCDKSEEVIRNILLSYDQDTDHFILGGKELQLTGRDVALIFGIVCATKKIPFKKPNARNAKWVKRNFGKDTKRSLNKTLIFNQMTSILDRTDETSVEDVARLMHCYLMVLVLTSGQSSSISWYLTDYLEDLEGAMTYDWCGYIAAILRNGIRNTRNLKI
ncbi:hypothetical protein OROMI_000896 [Orobanche minor]